MMRNAMIAELIKATGMRQDQAEWEVDDILRVLDQIGYRPITKEGYADLLRDSRFLAALESYGVDNWEGWDLVVQEMRDV